MNKFLCCVLLLVLLNLTFSYSKEINNNNFVVVDDDANDDDGLSLSLSDQVKLLSKQMNALMTRRREDYKLIENNLKRFVRKNSKEFTDVDVEMELEKLR